MFSLNTKVVAGDLDHETWNNLSALYFQYHCQGIDEGEVGAPEGQAALHVANEFDEFQAAIEPGLLDTPKAFKAYFENRLDAENALRAMTGFLRNRPDIQVESDIAELPEVDYTALIRDSFKPQNVTLQTTDGREHQLAILAPWHAPTADDVLHLVIEPGMAFGTGTHATTQGCLKALASLDFKNIHYVLDFGCGSGILALAAHYIAQNLYNSELSICGVDIDPLSLEASLSNAQLNKVEGFEVKKLVSELSINKFDLIIANILKGTLMEFASSFAQWLNTETTSGACIILSGLLYDQAADVITHFTNPQNMNGLHLNLLRRFDLADVHNTYGQQKDVWSTLVLRLHSHIS